ncbi:STAS domain-containing protein [Sphingomonas naphthae]|uniref:Anti-sigma factor antagonist n=1 Tax=Sphingomonas naphthae TaxID=1813468 RepID=A0ABY7TQP1_9SPHN|nr:STAS domain-containing protein [Sphingomonas naphthae]WCT74169.1 STAS domain-containing protein [Sphingomonas naphthae]
MRLTETEVQDVPVVLMDGRLDSRSAEGCANQLLKLVEDGRLALILDMSEVDYIGAAGLRVLLMLIVRATPLGVQVRLCNTQKAFRDVLRISELADRFPVYPNVDSAVEGIGECVLVGS